MANTQLLTCWMPDTAIAGNFQNVGAQAINTTESTEQQQQQQPVKSKLFD